MANAIASINQQTQVGVEVTQGTAVAANKLLECFTFQLGIEAAVAFYRATGRKYPAEQEENQEWTSGTMDGNLDYNGLVYPLSGIAGAATIGAADSSATAKLWTFKPPIAGNTSAKTFSFEQGDSIRARKFAYGLFTKFGYKGDRTSFTCSAELIGQLLTDGISLTSTPTAIALAPVVANQVDIYMDTTSGDIGTTKLTGVISVEYSMESVYGPAWFLNRANPSWSSHVDMEPKSTFKLMVQADAQGMGFLDQLRSGDTLYFQVNAQGQQIASDGGGGSDPVYQSFVHEFAAKLDKPDKWSDSSGIYAIQWNTQIVEDLAWNSGTAQQFKLINLLTAL